MKIGLKFDSFRYFEDNSGACFYMNAAIMCRLLIDCMTPKGGVPHGSTEKKMVQKKIAHTPCYA